MSDAPSPADPTDEELIRRVRAGDERAAAVLFARYEPQLRARARRVVGRMPRKVGVSDVLQETHLAAFAGIDRFEDQGPGSFRRWIESILDHKAADEVKRHLRAGRDARREVSRDADAPSPDPAGEAPTPSAVAMGEEERAALRRAVESMSEDDRTVLRLVHDEGKGLAEAAKVMDRTPDAVRKLYGRAIVRLGQAMRRSS